MYLTMLAMTAILPIKVHFMLFTKTLKLVILCAEFEIIIVTSESILYLPNTPYSIT